MSKKLFIVSNRLPVNAKKESGKINYTESVGGLATGLSTFYKEFGGKWIGWPGVTNNEINKTQREEIEKKLDEEYCKPVFLTRAEYDGYYNGFSNATLWPLCHYFPHNIELNEEYWNMYKKVNRKFADIIAETVGEKDYIWIQDYHLMLLPEMIRENLPQARIGYFLHIPFPSSEVFRQLPWREEILNGILGADLIGFHTYDYVRHFLSCVRRILGHDHAYGNVRTERNIVHVDTFPIGIDYEKYARSSDDSEVIKEVEKMPEKQISNNKVILTLDRLDYTKGIPLRLESFDRFLEKYPEYHEKVSMVMLSAPSRTEVKTYKDLKQRVDELVGYINGKYGSISWTPVRYLYRSVPFEIVAALYQLGDIIMVTPIRDGMNLVAKEYIAAKQNKKGVLILSETAGAAQELGEAIMVNPVNKNEVADAIKEALEMDDDEILQRKSVMQNRIKRYDINRWANDFLEKLNHIIHLQESYLAKVLDPEMEDKIVDEYKSKSKRLILLDYDGTLVGFHKKPQNAKPDAEVYQIIKDLTDDENNKVFIISGRDKNTLSEWFDGYDVGIVAEHGVWIKDTENDWRTLFPINDEWKKEIIPIMEIFVDRTPGSFLEEKEYSVVWHYRNVDPNMATVRVNELKEVMVNLTQNLSLGVLDGNKVIEIKNLNITKGSAVDGIIREVSPDFVLCIGDDATDEDMFRVLPEYANSIRVGITPSRAKYNIKSVKKVRAFLNKFGG